MRAEVIQVDRNDRVRLRRAVWLVGALAAIFVVVWRWPIEDPFTGAARYAPLHMTLEGASIVVAMLVFGVAWNAYSRERPGNVIILACALLASGIIDFVHTLSYAGMPDLITPSGQEKAINFWLAARAIAALAFLAVALRSWTPLSRPRSRWTILGASLALAALVVWAGIYEQDAWPRTFITGQGLTAFKVAAEYAIIAVLAVPALVFFRRSRRGVPYDAPSLFAASAISMLSELAFTLYTDVTDIFNLLGHVYKVVAYVFIYRAIFVSSVRAPFEQAKQAEAETGRATHQLSELLANLPTAVLVHAADSAIVYANPAACQFLGLTEEQLTGRMALDPAWHFVREDGTAMRPEEFPASRVLADRQPVRGLIVGVAAGPGAEPRWGYVNAFPEMDDGGAIRQVVVSFMDVTARLAADRTREQLALIVESSDDAIISKRLDGTILTWNKGAGAIYGYRANEMVGRSIAILAPPDRPDEIPLILARVARGERIEHFKTVRRRRDGTLIDVWLAVSPILDAGGVVVGASTIARDVTERRRAEEALRRLNRELRAVSDCNQALMRAVDEPALLAEICRIVCDEAGYRMAWVGYAEHDDARSVRPVASAGAEDGYLTDAAISWADSAPGRGPSGTAIRTATSVAIADLATDPDGAPWPTATARASPCPFGTSVGSPSGRSPSTPPSPLPSRPRRFACSRSSPATSPSGSGSCAPGRPRPPSRPSSARPRRWRSWASSRAGSPTTSTTC